jgi:hypothetical protein
LSSLLKKRFKRLTPAVIRKLERAREAALLAWRSRAVDARSLDAVFTADD